MQGICYTHEGLVLMLKELGVQLTKPTLRLLCWLMIALLEKTAAHLVRLAEKLPDDESSDMARRQRVRRFLSNQVLCAGLFVRVFVALLRPLVKDAAELVLTMDRTEWLRRGQSVNVLDVALYYRGRALPLNWLVLNRPGNTCLEQWKQVLSPVIEELRASSWTQGKQIEVAADREFASPNLSEWLWVTFRVGSTLRMKRSEYITQGIESQKVSQHLESMCPGKRRFLRDCTITQTNLFRMNVALYWEKACEEPWVLMTTHTSFPETIHTYQQRFGVEPMHKDWKSNAFDIEGSRVTQAKRIETLLIPIALCYHLCVLEGTRKENAGQTIRAHKQKRTTGLLLVGLSAFTRVLRATSLSRIQHFFERLFVGWLWPYQLARILKI